MHRFKVTVTPLLVNGTAPVLSVNAIAKYYVHTSIVANFPRSFWLKSKFLVQWLRLIYYCVNSIKNKGKLKNKTITAVVITIAANFELESIDFVFVTSYLRFSSKWERGKRVVGRVSRDIRDVVIHKFEHCINATYFVSRNWMHRLRSILFLFFCWKSVYSRCIQNAWYAFEPVIE